MNWFSRKWLFFTEVANVLKRRLGVKKEVIDAIRTAHREVPD